MPPGGSEVAATRQAAAAVRMGRLVNRQALGSRREQLNTCSVRHLEAAADVAVTLLELVDRHLEVGHAKDQNRLIAVEVFGQHQPRRVRCEPDHGNSSAEAFNGEDELCAQAVRVVLDVGGHVAARLVDEVELLEHAGASGGGPIKLVDDPVVERGRFDQFQRQMFSVALRQALAAPHDHWVHQKIQLVEKLQLEQRADESRRAAHSNLAIARLLELAYRVGYVALQQGGVVPIDLGQGA